MVAVAVAVAVGTAGLGTVGGASPAHAATPPCYSESQPARGTDTSRLDVRGCSAGSVIPNEHRAYATLLSSPNSTTASSCTIDIIAIRNSDQTILENKRGQDCTGALRKGTKFAYWAGTHPLTGGLRVDAGITLRFSDGGSVRFYSSDPAGAPSPPQQPEEPKPTPKAPEGRPPNFPPSAWQPGCSERRVDGHLETPLGFDYRVETYDPTHVPAIPTVSEASRRVAAGRIKINAETCHRFDGSWSVADVMSVNLTSTGAREVKTRIDSGFAGRMVLGIVEGHRIKGGAYQMTLQVSKCHKLVNGWDRLIMVGSLPLPGPWLVSAGAYVITKIAEHKLKVRMKCSALSRYTLRIFADRHGRLSWQTTSTHEPQPEIQTERYDRHGHWMVVEARWEPFGPNPLPFRR